MRVVVARRREKVVGPGVPPLNADQLSRWWDGTAYYVKFINEEIAHAQAEA